MSTCITHRFYQNLKKLQVTNKKEKNIIGLTKIKIKKKNFRVYHVQERSRLHDIKSYTDRSIISKQSFWARD